MLVVLADVVHPYVLEHLQSNGFQVIEAYQLSVESIAELFKTATGGIIIRSRFIIDESFIDSAPGLKFIARYGAGLENIRIQYAESKNIVCLHCPEGNRDAVAEHALGMLLMLLNNLHIAHQQVQNRIWKREENRGEELMGKTIGIIGYGNMGQAFAQRLKGFGVNVIIYDKYLTAYQKDEAGQDNLQHIFNEADVVSLHVPLSEETRYMINDSFINSFKKPFYLINTSRGKVVKTADAIQAIDKGKIKGMCLDVLEYESTSLENIELGDETLHALLSHPKVVLSPHIAGWSHQSNQKMATILCEKIMREFPQR
jgi:D-3-phosphoglycerate dehydrogenase / 2-oxoglutarate reductase